jgi:hypothetical protein
VLSKRWRAVSVAVKRDDGDKAGEAVLEFTSRWADPVLSARRRAGLATDIGLTAQPRRASRSSQRPAVQVEIHDRAPRK